MMHRTEERQHADVSALHDCKFSVFLLNDSTIILYTITYLQHNDL